MNEQNTHYWGRVGMSFSNTIPVSELVDLEDHPEKVMQWLKGGLAEIDGETYFPEEYEPNQPITDYFD